MNKHKTLVLIIFFLICGHAFSQSPRSERNVKINVPSEWINKLRNYDYKQDNLTILMQFESFIIPDTLAGSKAFPHIGGGILNPMFVNLDNDENEEVIGLFGWSEEEPTLAVFKMIGKDWFLIYLESFYMFYNSPELQVANNFSNNKTFYIRSLYERGSGIYCDAYHFYKLIDNKVYPCLALINRAHIFGWGLYLNQMIEMNFKFNSSNADELWVTYDYNFFPGAVYGNDVPWEGHEEISFVKGENSLAYRWDTTTLTYRPQIYKSLENLTEEKISCFGAFGNDTLFIKAFEYEIKQTLENGTSEQKKLLQIYIENVKTNQYSTSPTGEIEEKGKVGKLKFYGTKKDN